MILNESQLKNLISRLVAEADSPSRPQTTEKVDFKNLLSGATDVKIFFGTARKPFSSSKVTKSGLVYTSLLKGPKRLGQSTEGNEGIEKIFSYLNLRAFAYAFLFDDRMFYGFGAEDVKELMDELLSSSVFKDYVVDTLGCTGDISGLSFKIDTETSASTGGESNAAVTTPGEDDVTPFSAGAESLKRLTFDIGLNEIKDLSAVYSPAEDTRIFVAMNLDGKIQISPEDKKTLEKAFFAKRITPEEKAEAQKSSKTILSSTGPSLRSPFIVSVQVVETVDAVAKHLTQLFNSGNYKIKIDDRMIVPSSAEEDEAALDRRSDDP